MNGIKCRAETAEIFTHIDNYFAFLSMSYGDLNEVRTAELEINRLRQKDSFPEYLARFTGYASLIAWDEWARMARLYEGLKPRIKNMMAV
jgi:hypothetical protein